MHPNIGALDLRLGEPGKPTTSSSASHCVPRAFSCSALDRDEPKPWQFSDQCPVVLELKSRRSDRLVAEAEVIILDGRSCLFDPEAETDPSAWQPAADWLLSLRRRGKAVLLAHHANRLGGARGHSRPEDMLDVS